MKKIARVSRPSPALVIACIALFVAMGGVGFAALKLKPNSVKAKNIKRGAVTNPKIAKGAVTGDKFLLSRAATVNFGNLAGPSCASMGVPVQGIRATDHVLVTPPPGFPDTFTLIGRPEPATGQAFFAACNTFDGGGSVDPDGPDGSTYKLLVIR